MALGVVAVAGPASAAPPTTVSITVEMDLPDFCQLGPLVFSVVDVPVAAGPELTGAESEITANPCTWGGAVSVDVAPDGTITVATAERDSFQTTEVTVTWPGADAVTTVSDGLWEATGEDSCLMAPAVTTAAGGTVTIAWAPAPECTGNDRARLVDGGSAVFAVGEQPTPPSTLTPPTTDPAPTTPPAAARPATATPRFTG